MNPYVGCRVEYREAGIVVPGVIVERDWNESQMMFENRVHWKMPSRRALYEYHLDKEFIGNAHSRPVSHGIHLVPNGVEVMVELCD